MTDKKTTEQLYEEKMLEYCLERAQQLGISLTDYLLLRIMNGTQSASDLHPELKTDYQVRIEEDKQYRTAFGQDTIDYVMSLRKDGHNINQIAKMAGLSTGGVFCILKREILVMHRYPVDLLNMNETGSQERKGKRLTLSMLSDHFEKDEQYYDDFDQNDEN